MLHRLRGVLRFMFCSLL